MEIQIATHAQYSTLMHTQISTCSTPVLNRPIYICKHLQGLPSFWWDSSVVSRMSRGYRARIYCRAHYLKRRKPSVLLPVRGKTRREKPRGLQRGEVNSASKWARRLLPLPLRGGGPRWSYYVFCHVDSLRTRSSAELHRSSNSSSRRRIKAAHVTELDGNDTVTNRYRATSCRDPPQLYSAKQGTGAPHNTQGWALWLFLLLYTPL